MKYFCEYVCSFTMNVHKLFAAASITISHGVMITEGACREVEFHAKTCSECGSKRTRNGCHPTTTMLEVKACEAKENPTTFHERLNESSGSAAIYNTQQYECLTALKDLKLQNGKPQIIKEGSQKNKMEHSLPKESVMVSKSNIDNVDEKCKVKLYHQETLLEKTLSPCSHHEGSTNQNLEVGLRQQRTENIINLIQQDNVFDLCTPLACELVFNNANEKICQEMPTKYPENGNQLNMDDICNCQVMTDSTKYSSEMAAIDIMKDLFDPNLYQAAVNSIIKPQGISTDTPAKVLYAQENTERNNSLAKSLEKLQICEEQSKYKNSKVEFIDRNLIARSPHKRNQADRKKKEGKNLTGKEKKGKHDKNKTRSHYKQLAEYSGTESKSSDLPEGEALAKSSCFTNMCVHLPIQSQLMHVPGTFESQQHQNQNSGEQTNTLLSDIFNDYHADQTSGNIGDDDLPSFLDDILDRQGLSNVERVATVNHMLQSCEVFEKLDESGQSQWNNGNQLTSATASHLTGDALMQEQGHTSAVNATDQSQWRNTSQWTSGTASNLTGGVFTQEQGITSAVNTTDQSQWRNTSQWTSGTASNLTGGVFMQEQGIMSAVNATDQSQWRNTSQWTSGTASNLTDGVLMQEQVFISAVNATDQSQWRNTNQWTSGTASNLTGGVFMQEQGIMSGVNATDQSKWKNTSQWTSGTASNLTGGVFMQEQGIMSAVNATDQSQWSNNRIYLTSGKPINPVSETFMQNQSCTSAVRNINQCQLVTSDPQVPTFVILRPALKTSCPSNSLRRILPKSETISNNPTNVMTRTHLSSSSMTCRPTPSTSSHVLVGATSETKNAKDHGKSPSEEHKERIRKRFESKLNKFKIHEECKEASELRARSDSAYFFMCLVQYAVIMHKKEKLFAYMQLYLEDRKSGASMLSNINLLDMFGQTTLFDEAYDEELGFLIASGVDQNLQDQYRMSSSLGSILHFAVESGRVQTVQTLCEFLETNMDETNSNGFAPLHLAVKLKNRAKARKIIATLLESGAEPNIVAATNGKTPLHLAMERDHFSKEIVKLLINSPKIDVNLNTYSKQSPLHVGMTELLDDMIRNNNDGETLRRKNMKDCIVMLVQKGARVDGGTELKKRATERFGRNCNFIALHQKLKGIAQ